MTLFQTISKAEEFTSKGQLNEAVECYKDWLATSETEQHLRFSAFFNLGTLFHRLGKLDEAIIVYEEALQLKPDLSQASANLALALRAKEDSAQEKTPTSSSQKKPKKGGTKKKKTVKKKTPSV